MRAELFIELEDTKNVINALEPDMERTEDLKVSVARENEGLRFVFEAKSFSLLRGAVNSYLRLIKSVEGL